MGLIINETSDSPEVQHTATQTSSLNESVEVVSLDAVDGTPIVISTTANFAPAGPPGPPGPTGLPGTTGVSVVSIDNQLSGQTAVVNYSDGSTSALPLPHPHLVEYSWNDPYSYIAVAPHGSLVTDPVWRITRIEMLPDGSTTTAIIVDAAWTDRLTEVYA